MTNEDIAKLLSRLTQSLATKEDINNVKEDINNVKEDINNVKEDIQEVEMRLGHKIDELDGKLEHKIDELNSKADTILEFAGAINETTIDHEKRLKRIEAVPVIAHELKLKKIIS